MDSLMKACDRAAIPSRHEAHMKTIDGNHEWWGFNLTKDAGLNVIVQCSPLKVWGNPKDKPIPLDRWLVGGVTQHSHVEVFTAMGLLEALSEHGFAEVFARPDFILEL